MALAVAPVLAVAGWVSAGPIRDALSPCKIWTVVDSPKVKYGLLRSVDSTGPNDVWAVGESLGLYPIIDHWDGTTWTLTTQQGVATALNSVAAISPTDVWAGGYSTHTYTQPFLEHWDGTDWTTVPAPTPGVEGRVDALAAVSPTDVWAAGYWIDKFNGGHPLYLHWDGSAWMLFPGPSNRGQLAYALAPVSAQDIWAVGVQASGEPFTDVPMIQHWDGASWSSVRPAPIPGQGNRQLVGAAAMSSTDVWAVGYGVDSGAAIEQWDGVRWRYIRAPDDGILQDADAIAATDVWAVGSFASSRAISEHWNGTRWQSLPTPNPAGNALLFGVMAVSSTDIWAVGAHADPQFGGNYTPLTLHSPGTC